MTQFSITATPRTELAKHAHGLRQRGRIPAVVYGHGLTSQPLAVEAAEFQKIFRQAGSTSLVDLVVDGRPPVKVLIHAVDRHPTKSVVQHIDFYQVRMTEKLETDVELNFVGESPAVKEHGGIFVRSLDTVKVSCLPGDLVPSLEVDISRLKTFDDVVHVRDIVLPKGITILDKPEEVIASVTPPRSDEELAALAEAPVASDVSEVEVVKKEKAEDDEAEPESGETTEKKPAT